jgi:hypothetical protein
VVDNAAFPITRDQRRRVYRLQTPVSSATRTERRRQNIDEVIGRAPEIRKKFDLNFIELPGDLIAKTGAGRRGTGGTIPVGLYRGVVCPLPAAERTGTAMYGRGRHAGRFRIRSGQGFGRTAGTAPMEAPSFFLQYPQRMEKRTRCTRAPKDITRNTGT